MKKLRFDKLGIEIEMADDMSFETKETRNCLRVSYKNKKVVTILPDSKIEFLNLAHVICYKGRLVAYGNMYVEAWGRVFAKDKVCVLAYQGAEIRAGGRTKVRALDSSRVVAGGRAEVFLDGKSIGYRKSGSRVKINKLDNRATVFDIN
jgi:hypothetical protein